MYICIYIYVYCLLPIPYCLLPSAGLYLWRLLRGTPHTPATNRVDFALVDEATSRQDLNEITVYIEWLSICIYIYVYIHVHRSVLHICIYIYFYMYIYIFVFVYIRLCISIYIYTYVYSIYTYIHCRAERFSTIGWNISNTHLGLETFSEGRFLSKLHRRRGVAVQLATLRQAKNMSYCYLIGGVGVSLFRL